MSWNRALCALQTTRAFHVLTCTAEESFVALANSGALSTRAVIVAFSPVMFGADVVLAGQAVAAEITVACSHVTRGAITLTGTGALGTVRPLRTSHLGLAGGADPTREAATLAILAIA